MALPWVAPQIKFGGGGGRKEGENCYLKERGNKNWLKVLFI
jgi:hypothetical protein